jgi:hypothetical protein
MHRLWPRAEVRGDAARLPVRWTAPARSRAQALQVHCLRQSRREDRRPTEDVAAPRSGEAVIGKKLSDFFRQLSAGFDE